MVANLVQFNNNSSWQNWPIPYLCQDEVHLWCVSLDSSTSLIKSLKPILSIEEQNQAQRFQFDKDQKRFIITRATLRIILSRYLDQSPSSLHFDYGLYGKPILSNDSLKFNLSHSHQLALYAVTSNRELGIDLELLQTNFPYQDIVNYCFSNQEKAKFEQLPDHLRHQAFFNAWTRKEAYLKAIGKGLSLPLDQVEVSLLPTEPAALLRVSWNPNEIFRWSLHQLIPVSGYVATLAFPSQPTQIQYIPCH